VRIYEQHLPPARILELIAAADPGVQARAGSLTPPDR
jgi:hypothetical protein